MERLNQGPLSFSAWFTTHFFKVLGFASSLTVLIACNNNNSRANYVPPPVINGAACPACTMPVNPAPLTIFESQSVDGNIVLTNMQLMIPAGGVVAPNATGNNYKWYQGPIVVQGTLVVKQAQADIHTGTKQPITGCVLPAGTYSLQTQIPGQLDYQAEVFSVPSLIANGGIIELKISVPYSEGIIGLYEADKTRLNAVVSVVRANGIACSPQFFGTFN